MQTTAALILEDWLCWPGYAGHATDIKQIAFQRKQDGGLFSSGRFVTATCNVPGGFANFEIFVVSVVFAESREGPGSLMSALKGEKRRSPE